MLSDIPTLHMQSCCTALHCQRELTVAILACTSHHITHHHIITSPHHHITLHHTTSHYITLHHTSPHDTSPIITLHVEHHTSHIRPFGVTAFHKTKRSHGTRNKVTSLSHHMASHRISDVSERAICGRKKRQGK